MIGTSEDTGRDVDQVPIKRRAVWHVQPDRRSQSSRGLFDGIYVTGAR